MSSGLFRGKRHSGPFTLPIGSLVVLWGEALSICEGPLKNPSYSSQSTLLFMRHFGTPSSQEPAGWSFYIAVLWSWVLMFTSSERKYSLASPCYLLLSFLLLVFKYKNCPYKSGLGCLFCLYLPGGPMRAEAVADGLYETAPEERFSTEDARWDSSLLHKPWG